jgi:hypothetical protein
VRVLLSYGIYSFIFFGSFLFGTVNYFINKDSFWFSPLFFSFLFIFILVFSFRLNLDLLYFDFPTLVEQTTSQKEYTSSVYYNIGSVLSGFFEKTPSPRNAQRNADFLNSITPFGQGFFTAEDFLEEEPPIESTPVAEEPNLAPRVPARKLAFYGLTPIWEGTPAYNDLKYGTLKDDIFLLYKRYNNIEVDLYRTLFVEDAQNTVDESIYYPWDQINLTPNIILRKYEIQILKESKIWGQLLLRQSILTERFLHEWNTNRPNPDVSFYMHLLQKADRNFDIKCPIELRRAMKTFAQRILYPLEAYECAPDFFTLANGQQEQQHADMFNSIYSMLCDQIWGSGFMAQRRLFNQAVPINTHIDILDGGFGMRKRDLLLGDYSTIHNAAELNARQRERYNRVVNALYLAANENVNPRHYRLLHIIGDGHIRSTLDENTRNRILDRPDITDIMLNAGSRKTAEIFLRAIENREREILNLH